MNTGGIYIITNTESQKCYIGSTVNLKKRWLGHKSYLRNNAHRNPHLQYAWNKYGESVFEFGILEYLDNQEELVLAEQFWMDVYRLEGRVLYNCGLAACHPMLGRHHTEEAKHKMGRASRGRKLPPRTEEHCRQIGESNAKSYPALIHIKTGEVIPSGRNMKSLCRKYGLDPSNLRRVVIGKYKQHKGWMLKTNF